MMKNLPPYCVYISTPQKHFESQPMANQGSKKGAQTGSLFWRPGKPDHKKLCNAHKKGFAAYWSTAVAECRGD